MVDDVDAEFAKINGNANVVHEPKLMPWGNRTELFRNADGTLVAIYTPVSDAAKALRRALNAVRLCPLAIPLSPLMPQKPRPSNALV